MRNQNSLFSGAAMGYLSFFQAKLEPIMSSIGYSNYFSGLCGALVFICGIFGSFILGTLLHYIGRQHSIAFVKVLTSILIILFAGFPFVMRLPNQWVLLASTCSVFGFVIVGYYANNWVKTINIMWFYSYWSKNSLFKFICFSNILGHFLHS